MIKPKTSFHPFAKITFNYCNCSYMNKIVIFNCRFFFLILYAPPSYHSVSFFVYFVPLYIVDAWDYCIALCSMKTSKIVAVLYHAGVAHVVWPFDLVPHDELHQVEDGVGVERRRPRVEFIQDAAQRPEISCMVVWLLLHQLRRHVQWSSFDGGQDQGGNAHGSGKPAKPIRCNWSFWKCRCFYKKTNCLNLPKVTQLHHTSFSQQDILWFHVTVENAMGV